MDIEPDREFLCVYHADGSMWYCHQSSAWKIQEGVDLYMREGRDTLVSMETLAGSTILIKASNIDMMIITTLEKKVTEDVMGVSLHQKARDAIIESMGWDEQEED